MTRRRLWLLLLAVDVATVAAVVSLRATWFTGRPFDPAVWNDEDEVRSGARLELADRLVARGVLIGKTRGEVVDQLGEPPPTEYFNAWDLVYWLGPERGFISIDSEWLVLRLDADDRVVDSRIVRD